ncbi:hypothetical protein GOV05_02015 [Candidatus Woesearchaeota archaeon]|nr:hypothetical protein [Candidatus Woesearchaeota archaeon]
MKKGVNHYKLSKNGLDFGSGNIVLDKRLENLKTKINVFQQKNKLKKSEFYDLLTKPSEQDIPLSVFDCSLSPLEGVVCFLKNKRMTYSQIAKVLQRDDRTIWTTHQNGEKKKVSLDVSSNIIIPIDVFSDRTFSVLESATNYLVSKKGLKIKKIAELVGKSPITISTVYQRYKKKNEKK